MLFRSHISPALSDCSIVCFEILEDSDLTFSFCRYFAELVKLIYEHASKISRERVSLFYRHVVLHLFDYLHFKPL